MLNRMLDRYKIEGHSKAFQISFGMVGLIADAMIAIGGVVIASFLIYSAYTKIVVG